jgi:hypothetical protein
MAELLCRGNRLWIRSLMEDGIHDADFEPRAAVPAQSRRRRCHRRRK